MRIITTIQNKENTMSLKEEIESVKAQQEQAKTVWTKYQGILEYLEGKLEQEKLAAKEAKKKK